LISVVLSVLAALASLLRGQRYIHDLEESQVPRAVEERSREEAPTK